VIAPNFAISAVLMMRFAEMAAPFFDTAEIIELHHDRKIDAPSGTAVKTAERMAAARGPTSIPIRRRTRCTRARAAAPGRATSGRTRFACGHGRPPGGDPGAPGQTLTIRQDSYDRDSFMPGVVLACTRIAELPGLSLSLDVLSELTPASGVFV
jgi:4-hydroxy-tetrahydrodipicolinate reductase